MAATSSVVTTNQNSLLRKFTNKFRQPKSRLTANSLNLTEVQRLMSAASSFGRQGLRDATIIMMAYSHGLKVSELINLKWSHVNLDEGTLLVSRLKNGQKNIHPLSNTEIDRLRSLEMKNLDTEYIFVTERNMPLTSAHVRQLVKRAGQEAGFRLHVAPEMLSAGCKFNFISTRKLVPATQH
jgi:integrase